MFDSDQAQINSVGRLVECWVEKVEWVRWVSREWNGKGGEDEMR